MEKIILNNGKVFALIPMGIIAKHNNSRAFSFTSDLSYQEIEEAFNTKNINEIKYLSSVDELLKTYSDCVSLKSLSKEFNKEYEDDEFADIYMVELAIN